MLKRICSLGMFKENRQCQLKRITGMIRHLKCSFIQDTSHQLKNQKGICFHREMCWSTCSFGLRLWLIIFANRYCVSERFAFFFYLSLWNALILFSVLQYVSDQDFGRFRRHPDRLKVSVSLSLSPSVLLCGFLTGDLSLSALSVVVKNRVQSEYLLSLRR